MQLNSLGISSHIIRWCKNLAADCSSEWQSCAGAPGTPDSAIGGKWGHAFVIHHWISRERFNGGASAARKLLVTRPLMGIKVLNKDKFWKIANRYHGPIDALRDYRFHAILLDPLCQRLSQKLVIWVTLIKIFHLFVNQVMLWIGNDSKFTLTHARARVCMCY